MNNNTNASGTGPETVSLPMGVSIRECAALKRQLLGLIGSAEPVLIDVADVEVIDTAALQLLFAFGCERVANGRNTSWKGDSVAFREAAAVLGLEFGSAQT